MSEHLKRLEEEILLAIEENKKRKKLQEQVYTYLVRCMDCSYEQEVSSENLTCSECGSEDLEDLEDE